MGLVVTDADLDGRRVDLRADGGLIQAIEPSIEPEVGDDVLDAAGRPIMPGLVNGHGHAAMTLFRGYGDDLPLQEWLETRIWPAEARLDAESVYWGTRLACLEMLRSGTTRFFDMYWYARDAARAAADSGIRMVASQIVIELPGAPPENRPEAAADGFAALAEAGPLVEPGFSAHAIYTTSEPLLGRIAELADERGCSVQIHLSETEKEVVDCLAEHGERPTTYLDRVGLLHERMVLSHGVWLDDDELALIGERGATVVTNPISNMKLAVGRAFPYPAARAAGVPVGIGSDGAASNNTLDLLEDLKVLALLQKHTSGDPSTLPAEEALAVAHGQGSDVLGGATLEVGAPADLVLIDTEAVELTPRSTVASQIVYAASGAAVDSTVVAGRVVMRHRVIEDEEEVRAKAHEQAERVRSG